MFTGRWRYFDKRCRDFDNHGRLTMLLTSPWAIYSMKNEAIEESLLFGNRCGIPFAYWEVMSMDMKTTSIKIVRKPVALHMAGMFHK